MEMASPHIFNMLMSAYAKQHNFEKVDQLFSRMLSLGIAPDKHSYGITIGSAALYGHFDRVSGLVFKMLESRLEFDYSMWRVVSSGIGAAGDGLRLRGLIDAIGLHIKPTVEMWRDLIGVLGRAGKADEALIVLRVRLVTYCCSNCSLAPCWLALYL